MFLVYFYVHVVQVVVEENIIVIPDVSSVNLNQVIEVDYTLELVL